MTPDWTSGYVADIDYTYGYYGELNPLLIKLAFANTGYAVPEIGNACELGFGQGLSTNIHASASTVSWSGTDFNPAQAGFAQELSSLSGNNAQLFDESFAQYCIRTDLPDFDYIGLHGIWSWISDENRSVIVDFIARKLKVGGILYISYNTQPGWAAMMPMRDLLTEHVAMMTPPGIGIAKQIDQALEFTEKLIATKPLYARANPTVSDQLDKLKTQSRHYLAHEYFNRDWHPMSFNSMTNWLSAAKLTYVCSANLLDGIAAINITTEQQEFLNTITNPQFRESVRDMMINTRFRKDYWVKGPRILSALEKSALLQTQKFVLIKNSDDVQLKHQGPMGEVSLNEAIYKSILTFFTDHQAKTLSQLSIALKDSAITAPQILQAVTVLCGIGALAAAQDSAAIQKVKGTTVKLNLAIMKKSQSTSEFNYLASPITGGGIPIGRFSQLFLLAIHEGKKTPPEWAQYVWNLLFSQGQRLIKEGKTLESPEENLAELIEQANSFAQKQLLIFKALLIAE